MAIDRDPGRAIKVLRNFQMAFRGRHARIHEGAADTTFHRIRAIEGPCGNCANLTTTFRRVDGKPIVKVKCREGYSPIELSRQTPLGQEIECRGFEQYTQ